MKPIVSPRRRWERQDDESPAHFDMFVCYRDLDNDKRTVKNAWKAMPKPRLALETVEAICTGRHWVERANAYQDHMFALADRIERYRRVQSMVKMRERQRKLGQVLMEKAMRKALASKMQPETIPELATFIKAGMALEELGHHHDPFEAVVSGDDTEQPTEAQEARRLAIEVFTTGGAPMSADDIRNNRKLFYDQQPTSQPHQIQEPVIPDGQDITTESEQEPWQ